MKKLDFVARLSLGFLTGVWAGVFAQAEERPLNNLLLYADDWRHDTLGCAGNKFVQTP